ncbi:hypothetical protein H310_01285 [Aphanomyces invadans]|uniref:Uncharacterized protein n=1 Tax=Aphanomyces invadans TaxID=157072 RepID=A0A024US86_9STRA|nr:hypothetical protein H310_01285 [Aphanomyces invadans]ETW08767.1 hypothetical protein H310_01285 [Aphanomyces invadans]|eukprot:XP_008862572.1 hypothetical protein H310_01285 [Aphanomyces invadans]
MLVLSQDAAGRWCDVRVEDACSLLAQVSEPSTQLQISCVAFRVPVTTTPIVVLLPVPSSACLVAAGTSVFELVADILHCFPCTPMFIALVVLMDAFECIATVKPVQRTTFDSDSESDDDKTDRLKKKHKLATKDGEPTTLGAPPDYTAAWGAARVRLVSGEDLPATLAHLSFPSDVISSHTILEDSFVVAEVPPTTISTEGILNAGFIMTHPIATPGFLTSFAQRCIEDQETTIMWKQSVVSFNGCRELSEHGAGKTPPDIAEMLDNIRRRHASGTFTKLVLPTMAWSDVVEKYATTYPWIRGIHGDLRMRKIMQVLPTEPVCIRLNGS